MKESLWINPNITLPLVGERVLARYTMWPPYYVLLTLCENTVWKDIANQRYPKPNAWMRIPDSSDDVIMKNKQFAAADGAAISTRETVCGGSWPLGTACGHCDRCVATKPIGYPVDASVGRVEVERECTAVTHVGEIRKVLRNPTATALRQVEAIRKILDETAPE